MEPECTGCRERDARIARLEQQLGAVTEQLGVVTEQLAGMTTRVRDLEARLGQNASNSSIPPSANPPQAPPPVRKQPTGRKPGGQPGHAAHLRQRLPRERLTQTEHYLPDRCTACQGHLPQAPGPDDP